MPLINNDEFRTYNELSMEILAMLFRHQPKQPIIEFFQGNYSLYEFNNGTKMHLSGIIEMHLTYAGQIDTVKIIELYLLTKAGK